MYKTIQIVESWNNIYRKKEESGLDYKYVLLNDIEKNKNLDYKYVLLYDIEKNIPCEEYIKKILTYLKNIIC